MSLIKLASSRKSARGFTLVELLIAVSIVGILAAVAFPAYQDSVRKSRRADAMTSLLQIQLAQEKWRANNPSYTNNLTNVAVNGTDSIDGYYTLAISASSATQFTATATPKSGGPQAGDSCSTFTITQNGPDVSDAAKKACWNR